MTTKTASLAALAETINAHLASLPPAKRPRVREEFYACRVDQAGKNFEATTNHGHTAGVTVEQATSWLNIR